MNARPNQAVANFLIGPDCSFLKAARMIIAPTAGSQVMTERRLCLIIYSSRIELKIVHLQSGRGHAPTLNLCLSLFKIWNIQLMAMDGRGHAPFLTTLLKLDQSMNAKTFFTAATMSPAKNSATAASNPITITSA